MTGPIAAVAHQKTLAMALPTAATALADDDFACSFPGPAAWRKGVSDVTAK